MPNLLCRLIICCLLLLATPSFALDLHQLKNDFKQLDGVLVMQMGDQWIIDQDAQSGVHIGDLFSISSPGQLIVHPVTKKVLGSAGDTLQAVLRVTSIKSGYAYVQPVYAATPLKAGQTITRFKNIPAQFDNDSSTATNSEIRASVQTALPQLDWQASGNEEYRLRFRLLEGKLIAQSGNENTLHSYPLEATVTSAPRPIQKPVFAPPIEGKKGGILSFFESKKSAPITYNQVNQDGSSWSSPPFPSEAIGLAVCDLTPDKGLEIALLTHDNLEIGKVVDGKYKRLQQLALSHNLKPLSLEHADLDNDGREELYVSAMDDQTASSVALRYQQNQLQIFQDRIPFLLRSIINNKKISLVGQQPPAYFSRNTEIFQVTLLNERVTKGASLSWPKDRLLFGILPFDGNFAIIQNSTLKITDASGETYWQEKEEYGASEIFFELKEKRREPEADVIQVDVAPRMIQYNGALLTTKHKEKLLSTKFLSFSKGRVSAGVWDGTMLQESWHSRPLSGYLADFAIADYDNDGKEDLVCFYTFVKSGFLNKGRSTLISYKLE